MRMLPMPQPQPPPEPEPEPVHVDPVITWRTEQLVYAGAPLEVAERVAADRSIDLHVAVNLFKVASAQLAEAILL